MPRQPRQHGAPTPVAARFARNLKIARVEAGLTQRGLGDKVGVDPISVSRWERGKHTPEYGQVDALARALGRRVEWFYSEPEKEAA